MVENKILSGAPATRSTNFIIFYLLSFIFLQSINNRLRKCLRPGSAADIRGHNLALSDLG